MLTRKIKRKIAILAINEFIRHLSDTRRWEWQYESCANTVNAHSGQVVVAVDEWACAVRFAHYCRSVAVLSYRGDGIKVLGKHFVGVRGLSPKSNTPAMDAMMAHLEFNSASIDRATPLTRRLLERFKLTPDCVSIGRTGNLTVFEAKVPRDSPWWGGPRVEWASVRLLPNDGGAAWDIGPRPKGCAPFGVSRKAAPSPPKKRRGKPAPKPPPKPPGRRVGPPGAPRLGPPPPPPMGTAAKRKTTPPPPTKKARRR